MIKLLAFTLATAAALTVGSVATTPAATDCAALDRPALVRECNDH